jgi:shikimate kinase
MVVLVIGPSGVGKSSALKVAEAAVSNCVFASLDRLARDRGRQQRTIGSEQGVNDLRRKLGDDNQFLNVGIEAVNELVRVVPHKHHVIDVGAGFMDASTVACWFRQHTLIALLAPPEVVYARIRQARGDGRTLEQYKDQEFSKARKALYQQAVYTINADCTSAEDLGSRLVSLLLGVANRPL